MPRGKHGSKRGRSPSPRERKQVKLLPQTIAIASSAGGGGLNDGVSNGLSDGIDKFFSRMPTFYKVLTYLQSQEDEIAQALLIEMEDLEIDRVYQECVAEGVITIPAGNGEAAAWIV